MAYSLEEGDVAQMNGSGVVDEKSKAERVGKLNSAVTTHIVQSLIPRGFMVDYAPALSHQVEKGSFSRAVVNILTIREAVARLVQEIHLAGQEMLRRQELHG